MNTKANGLYSARAGANRCARCRRPLIVVVAGQTRHPLCEPDAWEPLTLERWDALLAAQPKQNGHPS